MDNLSDKYKFQELFDDVSKNTSNLITGDYIDKLINLLEFRPSKKHCEMYKYTLFLLSINKEKIDEIFKKNKNSQKIEKLKISIILFIDEDEENYKSTNKLTKILFSEVFEANKNKISNHNEKQVDEKKEIAENCETIIKNEITTPKKVECEPQEIISDDIKPNISTVLTKNSSYTNNLIKSHEIQKNFEQIKKEISIPNNTNHTIVKNNDQLTSKEIKAEEDMRNKIDAILEIINKHPEFKSFIKEFLTAKPQDLFNQPGFFSETTKLRLLQPEYKLKLLTIYSRLFYIFTLKQRDIINEKIKSEIIINLFENESKVKILENIFYEPTFENLFIQTNRKKPNDLVLNLLNDFYSKDSDKNTSNEILLAMKYLKSKSDITDLFYIFSLNEVYRFLDEMLYSKLLFFLYILMTKHHKISGSYELLYSLFIIKTFFSDNNNIGNNFFQRNDKNEAIYKTLNFKEIYNTNIDFNIFFSEHQKEFCEDILQILKYFFKLDNSFSPNILFVSKNNNINFDFIMNIIEMFRIKKNFIYKQPHIYKRNLITLEEILFTNYKKFNKLYNHEDNFINVKIYREQYEAFQKVGKFIDDLVEEQFKNLKVTIYPFGSITQFLGSKESDLDIYIHIEGGNKQDKLSFMKKLDYRVTHKYYSHNLVVTKRLITISFENEKNIKIDLNYFGICSVLNSNLLRVYAQCDMRFIILAHNVKIAIKSIGVNNSEERKSYVNSFCWMLLLVTFLQDVITPPVLPKILSKSQLIKQKIETGNLFEEIKKNNKEKKNNFYNKSKKNIEDVINNTYFAEYDVNYKFNDEFQSVYMNFKESLDVKNEMSLSELFIKFFEFVVFYFKYDTIYLHTSFAGECFMNKSEIKNFENLDKNFFNSSKKLIKKADFLVREPFDHSYSPCQMINPNTKFFLEKLKEFYYKLLEKGTF